MRDRKHERRMKRIAINGFGRIGKAAFKIIIDTPELEVIAVKRCHILTSMQRQDIVTVGGYKANV